MTRLAALGPALAVASLALAALAGCGSSGDASTSVDPGASLARADLEKRLSTMYTTASDPTGSIDASCRGDLAAEVDATQDCRLEVGGQSADVRVRVSSVSGSDPKLDVTPFLTADKVAASITRSLAAKGFGVDSVDCASDLVGEKGRTVDCTAAPADGDGRIVATVSSVDGLRVRFDYEVVS